MHIKPAYDHIIFLPCRAMAHDGHSLSPAFHKVNSIVGIRTGIFGMTCQGRHQLPSYSYHGNSANCSPSQTTKVTMMATVSMTWNKIHKKKPRVFNRRPDAPAVHIRPRLPATTK